MSRTIDESVVKMTFDNSKFESNVGTSLKTLDKLKNALNFKNAGEGLQKSLGKVDFSAMQRGLEAVSNKFSLLGTIGDQVIRNITDKVVNAGQNMANAITLAPIMDGMHEYETQLNSVQTILANTQSKGSTIKDVNSALDELNTYADKTIYNFTEMTRNIGTFTAAGVGLKESTQAIKGIANLAAVSGSSSQQASVAMYQLSQALAAGKVGLQDWNSVVNAGMGGEVFQEALKRTARVMGTGVDAAIEKFGTFRESLTRGQWLTKDVLTETLAQISGAYDESQLRSQGYSAEQAKEILELAKTAEDAATKVKTFTQLIDTLKEALGSGWTTTWRWIFGDFEQAKAMWTSVSDVLGDMINRSSDARNAIVQEWSEFGGRQSVILAVKYTFEALMSVIDSVKNSFTGIFPPITARTLLSITANVREFAESLKLSNEQLKPLRGVAQGVFGAIKIALDQIPAAIDLIKSKVRGIGEEFGFGNAVKYIVDFASKLGFVIGYVAKFGSEAKIVGRKFEELKEQFGWFDSLVKIFTAVKNGFLTIFPPSSTGIMDKISSTIHMIVDDIKAFAQSLSVTQPQLFAIQGITQGVFGAIKMGAETVINVFNELYTTIQGLIAKAGFGGLAEAALNFAGKLGYIISDISRFGVQADIVSGRLKNIREEFPILGTAVNVVITAMSVLKSVTTAVWSIFKSLLNLATGFIKSVATGFDSALGVLTKKVDTSNLITLADVLEGIRNGTISLSNAIAGVSEKFNNFGNTVGGFFARLQTGIINMITGIRNFFGPILNTIKTQWEEAFGEFDFAQFTMGVMGVGGSLATVATMLDAIKGPSESVSNLFDALKDTLTGDESLFGKVKGTFGSIKGAMDGLKDTFEEWQKSIEINYIKSLAIAIAILAGSLVLLAGCDPGKLVGAVTALGGLGEGLVQLIEQINELEDVDTDSLNDIAKSMVVFSAAIFLLSKSVATMGQLNPEQLLGGLAGVVVLITAIVQTVKELDKAGIEEMASGMGSLILFAVAIRILASSVKALGELDLPSLAKGLGGVAVLLAGIVLFLKYTKDSGMSVGTGAALILLAAGLKIMASAVLDLVGVPFTSLAKGLLVIAGMLGAFVITAKLLSGCTAGLITAGIAFIALAAGMKIISGVILSMVAIPYTSLGKSLIAFGAAIVIMCAALGALGTIGPIAIAGGAALLMASVGIMALAGALKVMGSTDGMKKALISLGIALVELAAGLTLMIIALPGALAMKVVAAALLMLLPVLVGLGSLGWDAIIKGLVGLGGAFVIIAAAALGFTAIAPLLLAFAGILVVLSGALVIAGVGLLGIGAGLMGISTALTVLASMAATQVQIIVASIKTLVMGIVSLIPEAASAIAEGIVEFISTIAEQAPVLIDIIKNLIPPILEGLKELIPQLLDLIGTIITQVADFITTQVPVLVSKILVMLTSILMQIQIFLPVILQMGTNIVIEFINGISNALPRVIDAAFKLIISFMNGLGDAFRKNGKELGKAGRNMISGVLEGIADAIKPGGAKVVKKMGEALTKVKEEIEKFAGKFLEAGKNLIQGFINGLKDNKLIQGITKAATGIADTAKNTITNKLKEKSPSKVGLQQGSFYTMGIANGISSMGKAVETASSDVADGAISAMSDSLSALGLIQDFDANPVIAPVLDLSNIQNGVSEMNDMFTSSRTFDMAASISDNMAARKMNRMTDSANLRSALASVNASNLNTSAEIASLQDSISSLKDSLARQSNPDFSELQSAINNLNTSIANQSNPDFSALQDAIANLSGSLGTQNNATFTNTFNIQSNDPKGASAEISKELQRMINRRSAVWA